MTAHQLLGAALALTIFLAVNGSASIAALLLWPALRSRAVRWNPRVLARAVFALRVVPAAAAAFACAALFVPAWLAFEPRHTGESAGVRLGFVSAVSLALIVAALVRIARLVMATRRLSGSWSDGATPLTLADAPVEAFSISHEFPVMAVVGFIHPRLYVARQICEALSEAELSVAARHEAAHVARRDNLKRAVMLFCRALAPLPATGALDREWSRSSEIIADADAVANGPESSLDLAAALIKIARLAPRGASLAVPSAAFITGDSGVSVAERVRRLAERSDERQRVEGTQRKFFAALAGVAVITAAFIAVAPPLWLGIHNLIEAILLVAR